MRAVVQRVSWAEVRIDERIPELLQHDEVVTLADGGRYLLLELPGEASVSPVPNIARMRRWEDNPRRR